MNDIMLNGIYEAACREDYSHDLLSLEELENLENHELRPELLRLSNEYRDMNHGLLLHRKELLEIIKKLLKTLPENADTDDIEEKIGKAEKKLVYKPFQEHGPSACRKIGRELRKINDDYEEVASRFNRIIKKS